MKAIAAVSYNNIIGADGGIPWKCSSDMKWFKEFTMGQKLIVGGTTFRQLPFLPGRRLYVYCRGEINTPASRRYDPHDLHFVNDIDILPKDGIVAGGAKVYQELLPYCDELYLTKVRQFVKGDTEMPPYQHFFNRGYILRENDEMVLFKYTK